ISDGPSLTFGTGDFLVIEVATTDANHNVIYWDKSAGAPGETLFFSPSVVPPSFTTVVGDKIATVAAPPGNGVFILLTMIGQATAFRITRVQATGGNITVDLRETNVPATICNGALTEVAEVIAVKGTVSIEDTRRIEKYLKVKYNL